MPATPTGRTTDDKRPATATGPVPCRVVVCRDCCCGSPKVTGVDHEAQTERLRAAVPVRVSDCLDVCDQAMDVVGGPGYFRGSVVERAYRDIRAAKFHPLTADATHVETGRHELGLPGLLQ